MARQVALVGLDIGTSGCKAVLIDAGGRVLHERTSDYPLQMPRPLWSEQDPERWWEAVLVCTRDVARVAGERSLEVAGIGLTGQMHGLVLLDGRGGVLRPAILWNDQRTAAECEEITQRVGASRVIELTGNPVLTGFTAPKIAWVRTNEPDVYARIAKTLLPKDFVRYRLTGEFYGDVSDASGTALFDIGRRRWSDEMCAAVGVPAAWLPAVTESPVASATLSPEAARQVGLPAGVPIVAGAGDQAAQAVGTGIVDEGAVSATIGTSGVMFAASQRYRVDPGGRLHAFCHAVPGQWHLMGVMLSAGGSLSWLATVLDAPEDRLIALASQSPPGCEGLLFLPYLTGERTPHADPHARGVLFGLTARHRAAHLARAVLEGVCYGLRDSLEIMRELGLIVGAIRGSGGGLRSDLWRQVLADVLATPVESVNTTAGAALGAALLAGVGAKVFDSVQQACAACVRPTGSCIPGPAAQTYAVDYPRFQALYPALQAHFRAIR